MIPTYLIAANECALSGLEDGCTIHLQSPVLRWTYLSVPDENTSVARV